MNEEIVMGLFEIIKTAKPPQLQTRISFSLGFFLYKLCLYINRGVDEFTMKLYVIFNPLPNQMHLLLPFNLNITPVTLVA